MDPVSNNDLCKPLLNERYYAALFSTLPEVLVVADRNGLVLDANPALYTILGYSREDLLGKPVLSLIAEADVPAFSRSLTHDHNAVKPLKTRLCGKKGQELPAEVSIRQIIEKNGLLLGHAFLIRDISDQTKVEEDLMRGALYDGLTGLPNKGLFRDRVHRLFARSRRNDNGPFAVAYLDLDFFKRVNDAYGHDTGDQVLIAAARRIESCLRPGDTVARLGGDEFGIVIDAITDAGEAAHIVNRILEEISRPMRVGAVDLTLTASAGFTLNALPHESPEDLIQHADMAMYRAKNLGRARCQIFDEAMHERALKRLEMESDMRAGLDRNEFRIYYHPIFSLEDMKIVGAEALVRWQHPMLGLLSAGQFLPLAEETGLILPLGEWVFRQVLAHQKSWPCRINVALNISSTQFANREFFESFTRTLRDEQADSTLIRIDVTENTLMQNIDYTISVLNALNALGIQILVDDFGTGSSSLGYLKQFPISTLKMDRSFINEIPDDADFAKVVKAAISMAHILGIRISAEGVENEAQLEFLKIYECDEAQGYLFNKPMPAAEFAALIDAAPHTFRHD